MDIHDLIEMFNEGNTDFLKYINDIETFFKILHKRGLLDKLDPEGKLVEDYQNELLLFYYNEDEEKFWEYVLKFLQDVDIIEGKPYIFVDRIGEFSKLFCNGNRNDISPDTIESILDGDYDNYWSFRDLTDNVYRDVIEELNENNILSLKEYIIKSLEGVHVIPHTELLENYAEEQNHPEYVTIDKTNIDQILDDKETMDELLNNELEELKGELYQIFGNAYQTAYEEELYEGIWDEISTYFEKGKWVSRPHIYQKNTSVEKYVAPIQNFESNVLDFLNNNKGYTRGTLEYWGSYFGILEEEFDCLSYYAPDYPDSFKVDKYINIYFTDHI